MDEAWFAAEAIITNHNVTDPNNAIVNAIMEAIREGEQRVHDAAAARVAALEAALEAANAKLPESVAKNYHEAIAEEFERQARDAAAIGMMGCEESLRRTATRHRGYAADIRNRVWEKPNDALKELYRKGRAVRSESRPASAVPAGETR